MKRKKQLSSQNIFGVASPSHVQLKDMNNSTKKLKYDIENQNQNNSNLGWFTNDKITKTSETKKLLAFNNTLYNSEKKSLCYKLLHIYQFFPFFSTNRKYIVSLFWSEKLWMFIDLVQIFAIFWIVSQPWPWPYTWLKWTRWTVFTNLDFVSWGKRGAPMSRGNVDFSAWGEQNYYDYYVILYTFVLLILLLLFKYIHVKIKSDKRGNLEKYLLIIMMLLYLPFGLAIIRLWNCDSERTNDEVLSVDPSIKCWTLYHYLLLFICNGIYFLFALGLPYYLKNKISNSLTYLRDGDHEKYLQSIEFSYMLYLNDEWIEIHSWLFSSFKRKFVYFRTNMLYMKLFLLLGFSWLRWNLKLQAFYFWIIITIWGVKVIIDNPFRCKSSYIYMLIMQCTLMINFTFGFLTGNEVSSAILVASTQTVWLLSINALMVIFLFIFGIWSIFYDDWPTFITSRKLKIDDHHNPFEWVDAIRHARMLLIQCSVINPSVVPIHLIEEELRILRRYWVVAKAQGSLLEILIRECLDELAAAHQKYRSISSFPGGANTDDLIESYKIFNKRKKWQSLMNPKKRRILLKILALSAWMGNRQIRSFFPQLFKVKSKKKLSAFNDDDNDDDDDDDFDDDDDDEYYDNGDDDDLDEDEEYLENANDILIQTNQAIIPPFPPIRELELADLLKTWKRTIRAWERDFENVHNRKPTIKDKNNQRKDWYDALRKVELAFANIKKDSTLAHKLTRVGHFNASKEADKSLVDLVRKTEDIIVNASIEKIDDINHIHELWRGRVMAWEMNFKRQYGVEPQWMDKRRQVLLYDNNLKTQALIEMFNRNNNMNDGDNENINEEERSLNN